MQLNYRIKTSPRWKHDGRMDRRSATGGSFHAGCPDARGFVRHLPAPSLHVDICWMKCSSDNLTFAHILLRHHSRTSMRWVVRGSPWDTRKPVDGQAMLEELEQRNLSSSHSMRTTLVPLSSPFRRRAESHLERVWPQKVSDLHRRASQWYEQQGFIPEAIHHSLVAQDRERRFIWSSRTAACFS